MSDRLIFFLALYFVFAVNYVSCKRNQKRPYAVSDVEIDPNIDYDINVDVESLIAKYQEIANTAENLHRVGVSPAEDIESIYDDMIDILDELIEIVGNSNNAYKFLKLKGLERITIFSLSINYDDLKTRILLLLKVLFGVAPTTTSAVIPVATIDRLVEIYERNNLDLKTLSLEVLILWLPGNPKIQARLMKIKGLIPFYDQLKMLDAEAMRLLLELFNRILNEHLIARSEVQRSILDADKLKFYQRIGLLEHMATPAVCNGLLNIFSTIWSYNSPEADVMMTMFELLKNIKQFCLKIYHGKSQAVQLVTALRGYIKKSTNYKMFTDVGVNMTEIESVLEDYVTTLKYSVKEEL